MIDDYKAQQPTSSLDKDLGQDLHRRTVSDDLCFLAPFKIGTYEFSVEFLMVTKKAGGTGVQQSLVNGMQKA